MVPAPRSRHGSAQYVTDAHTIRMRAAYNWVREKRYRINIGEGYGGLGRSVDVKTLHGFQEDYAYVSSSDLAVGGARKLGRRERYNADLNEAGYRPKSGESQRSDGEEQFGETETAGGRLKRAHKSEYSLNSAQRLDDSAALRVRGGTSQIDLSHGGLFEPVSTAYRDQNQAIERPHDQVVVVHRPLEHSVRDFFGGSMNGDADVNGVNGGQPGMSSVSQLEYGRKSVERVEAVRPTTSDHWKLSAEPMAGESVNQSEFGPKRVERTNAVRPRDAGVFEPTDFELRRETSNLSDYGPKRAERSIAVRPRDSDVLKREGTFDDVASVNRTEYSNTKGERYEIKRPKDSDLFQRSGTFEGTSVNQSDYSNKKGERYDLQRPKDSDIFKRDGAFEGTSVNRSEYSNTKGDRYERNASFEGASVSRSDYYSHGKGERHDVRRPKDSDVFKREGSFADATSVNRSDYSNTRGERYAARKPKDSDILKHNATANGDAAVESTSRADYRSTLTRVGDRYPASRPRTSDMWKRSGKMELQSVNRADYFASTKGDRYETKRRTESNVLRGKGPIGAESTSSRSDYAPKTRGDRYPQKPHGSADVWKKDGTMESNSVNRSDYGKIVKGERYDVKKLEESDVWTQSGRMQDATVSREEYTRKKAERPPVHIPMSNLQLTAHSPGANNGNGTTTTFMTVTHEDFGPIALGDGGTTAAHSRAQSRNAANRSAIDFDGMACGASSTGHYQRSVTRSDFDGGSGGAAPMRQERAKRPSTALRLAGDRELTSSYEASFNKTPEPCIAGELIESVKRGHAPTKYFEFKQVDESGHHFYESKRTETTAEASNGNRHANEQI